MRTDIAEISSRRTDGFSALYNRNIYVPLSHLRSKETTGQYISYFLFTRALNDIALSTGHYNDIARESCSFELFDLLSDIQTEVELHSLYRRVNSISIVGFSFKV